MPRIRTTETTTVPTLCFSGIHSETSILSPSMDKFSCIEWLSGSVQIPDAPAWEKTGNPVNAGHPILPLPSGLPGPSQQLGNFPHQQGHFSHQQGNFPHQQLGNSPPQQGNFPQPVLHDFVNAGSQEPLAGQPGPFSQGNVQINHPFQANLQYDITKFSQN
jgi:hypothetical protein